MSEGNGHNKDLGIERETREPKPCLARIDNGRWCQLSDRHDGEHRSDADPIYGPIERRPPLWRRHKGRKIVG